MNVDVEYGFLSDYHVGLLSFRKYVVVEIQAVVSYR